MFNETNLWVFFPWDTEMVAENDWSGNPIYVGYAKIGNVNLPTKAVWKIMKLTYDSNNSVIKKQFASNDFNMIRDNRATYF